MSYIYRELKHCKTITLEILTKKCILFFIFLCLRGQVKKYKNPHNTIFTVSVHIKPMAIFQEKKFFVVLR